MPLQQLSTRRSLGTSASVAIALALGFSGAQRLSAQQPLSAAPSPPNQYRPPALTLVQPENGASIPQDRPIIVYRFLPGDSTDLVDVRSFVVSVDGKDRARLFQSARDMVWGPLAPPDESSSLAVGTHAVSARICSIRGACVEVSGSITVAAPSTVTETPPNRKRSLIDLVLAAVKKLLAP